MNTRAADLLAALDDERREVATHFSSPVIVLAGAGTGKTRAMTHRIAYGIATEVFPPHHVLALTFTAKAAGEMRARSRSLGVPAVQARTFHSAPCASRGSSGTASPAVTSPHHREQGRGARLRHAGPRHRRQP